MPEREGPGQRVWHRMRSLWGQVTKGFHLLLHDSVARCRVLIGLATFLVLVYALAVAAYVLSTPDIGVRCAFTLVVNQFDSNFYSGGVPLRSGDHITHLGGEKVENWSHLLRKLKELGRQPAHEVQVLFTREATGTKEHTVTCKVGPPPLETLIPSVLWFVLKIGLFIVGAIVFWKRPKDRSASLFFLFCTVSFGAYLGGYHWSRIVTQPVLILVFMCCAILFPAVSLHFYLVFPRPKAILERCPGRVLAGIYGLPLLFLVLLVAGFFLVRSLDPEGSSNAVEILLQVMLRLIYCYFGVATVWYLASIVSLLHSFWKAQNLTERNQVKWILYGLTAALMPIGYSLYLAWAQSERFGGGGARWPMFVASLFVTAAFTISITRYRLMELDQLVSSGVGYFLVSFLAGIVYYGLVFVGMVLVGSRTNTGPFLWQVLGVSATALVMLIALDLVRGRIMRALNRRYRREKYHLDHTLKKLSQAVEQLVDPAALAHRLLHTSAEVFGVSRGAIYLRQDLSSLYRLAGAVGPETELRELSSGCPLVEYLFRIVDRGEGSGPVFFTVHGPTPRYEPESGPYTGHDPEPVPEAVRRQLDYLGGELAHALFHEGQLYGLLVLGERESGPYTPEDLHLLSAFVQITVLALLSTEGHRTIEALNQELQSKVEKIAEQQRRILSLQSQLLKRSVTEEQAPVALLPKATEPGQESARANHHGAESSRGGAGPASSGVIHGMVGSSFHLRQLLKLGKKVAASDSAVLLRGESGTGKEVLARAIHENSPRARKPFLKVHCAALSPSLLESELFGHVKGAFTNAIRDKVGRFEAAHGGTLFLDEIGDVTLEVQTKLLRVLQEKTFERVGSSEPVQVDVRIIAATHQDLEALMREGRFRQDLFYRLNVFPITLPPLRERAEDIPELAQHFLHVSAGRAGKEVSGLDDEALACLKAFSWPGNIRQLENVIERAVVVAEGEVITLAELPQELVEEAEFEGIPLASSQPGFAVSPSRSLPLPDLAEAVRKERGQREAREREQLVRALAGAGGNKAEAARALGMARSTLVSKLKRLGLG
jgi:transcriptional regulator with GAF, ATPase, and Fis domain